MSYPIEGVEGIGAAHGKKLVAAGIASTAALLKRCADPAGRKAVAAATGLSEQHLLKWANLADLMRIKGIGTQWSELLEATGVDTVKELRHRRPDNLAAKLAEVNAAKKLVRALPSEKRCAGWVAQANALPGILTY